jgi:hypothetical protein
VVELAAIGQEIAFQVVDLLELRLHLADALADGDAPAELRLQPARRREVIGMGMRFEQPLNAQALLAHRRDDAFGRVRGRAACAGVEVEHRVDHGGVARRVVPQQMRHRPGVGVVEGLQAEGVGRVAYGNVFAMHGDIIFFNIL